MNKNKTEIRISIISHTNIGKTTLARTLLRRDVGEVRDRDHVTTESTEYTMLENDSARLIIWDTPGFGANYANKLLKRLRSDGSAGGWLMHEIIDRLSNRPLFCSLQAARNVRSNADAVLYLVNAKESPSDATYVKMELELLNEIGKPVLLVINQVDQISKDQSRSEYTYHIEQAWHEEFGEIETVKKVLVLDAFSRVWLEELEVLREVANQLPKQKQTALGSLCKHYEKKQSEIIRECSLAAASTLEFAANQKIVPAPGMSDKEIFRELYLSLQNQLDDYVETVMSAYELEAGNNPALQADIEQVKGLAGKKIPEGWTGILSAALTGAGGGLAADAMSGGLTFGGGALIGFIIGGIGGLTAAKSINHLLKMDGDCRWSESFLYGLFKQLLFYHLLIAHHGRGKGLIDFEQRVKLWNESIEKLKLPRLDINKQFEFNKNRVAHEFESSLFKVLNELYPES